MAALGGGMGIDGVIAHMTAQAEELPRAGDGAGLRSFDPMRVGRLESDLWVAYYRRKWARFLALSVRPAAEHRAAVMDLSDQWVAESCDPASPLLTAERAELVRSYEALLAAVHR